MDMASIPAECTLVLAKDPPNNNLTIIGPQGFWTRCWQRFFCWHRSWLSRTRVSISVIIPHFVATQIMWSVLEYLSREDADRAIKELDGRELRGRPVRVTLDDSVRECQKLSSSSVIDIICFSVVVVRTIIDVMIVATTAIGMTAIGMIDTAGTVPDHLLAVQNMTIVDPGLRPTRGRIMIEGLQGTMITGEEAMMTADSLIIIMTVAGMISIVAGTIEDVTRRTNATMKEPDMWMVKVVGLVNGSLNGQPGQRGFFMVDLRWIVLLLFLVSQYWCCLCGPHFQWSKSGPMTRGFTWGTLGHIPS